MALSEHDLTVLRELEAAFTDDATSAAARSPAYHAPRRRLAAAIGVLVLGVAATAVGLRLEDNLGTGLGVLGFIFIVYSCWAVARSPLAGRGWLRAVSARCRTAVRAADLSRPSQSGEEGP